MPNCVTLNFNDVQIFVSKSSIKFSNGYGIVDAFYYSISDGVIFNIKGIGVVDKDYNVILDFSPHNYLIKLVVLPHDNFIYLYNSDKDGLMFYDATYVEGGFRINVKGNANDFEVLNDNVIKIDISNREVKSYALYNPVSKIFITDIIHYVGEFKFNSNYGVICGEVCYYVYDNNDNILEIISYVIDLEGNILSDFTLINSNESYTKEVTFEQVVKRILQK